MSYPDQRRLSVREELSRLIPMAAAGVLLGVASAMIVLPHPVDPLDPPQPSLEAREVGELDAVASADRATRARIEREPLPPEIRAVGSAYLEWNAAAAAGTSPRDPKREAIAQEIRSALGIARNSLGGEGPLASRLRELRAYHADYYLEELSRLAKGAQPRTPSKESERLGGALTGILARNGWIDETGALVAPAPVVRARFKLHWTSIVYSLEDCEQSPAPICYAQTTLPLEPSELRALLAYLIQHPVVRHEDVTESGGRDRAIDRRRLVYLDRLAAVDRFADPSGDKRPIAGDYPLDLARGVLLHRLGRYDEAAGELERYMLRNRSDARARNWLLGAVARARGE